MDLEKTYDMKKFTFLQKTGYSYRLQTPQRLFGLIMVFCIFLFTYDLHAQESTFYKLPDTESETRTLLSKNNNIDVDKVLDLIHNLPPMIYIENNKIIMVTEENPSVLVLLDTQSFDFLHINNTVYNKVELITIQINQLSDLNQKMDFSQISGFDELKYIYIQCSVKCNESQIKSMILNSSPKNTVLFKVITPA